MPLPVISIAQMRDWESATWAGGKTEQQVIHKVGLAIAEQAQHLTDSADFILILAGKGNNGEDARCASQHLANRKVQVLNVTDPASDLTKLDHLLSRRPALIIDGLFGIGLNRPLSQEWFAFINRVNEAQCQALAVDVPSGLNADTGAPQDATIRASVTVTVGAPKIGLLQESAWPFVGRLEVAQEVGLVPCPATSEVQWTTAEDFKGFPPRREAATHKGSYGHLGILAGSVGYHGAAVLTAKASQRAQPGLITLYSLESVYQITASQLQAVMVAPWNSGVHLPGDFNAVLVGPGLAAPDAANQMKQAVRNLWRVSLAPVILDASGLDWIPMDPTPRTAIRVLTPHPGEAARLCNSSVKQVQADRIGALRNVSRRFGNAWVVLKGHQTLVGRSSGPVYVNSSGNPHLAQGGSGDVLAGFLAGLLAQPRLQNDASLAIRYAVWEHGAAADRLNAVQRNWTVEDLSKELASHRAGKTPLPSESPTNYFL
jgi:NAD(P)H-hydrate epimerase